jgi:hypothetical protein
VTWAFSDESERAATMYFGVLLIDPRKVPDARRALRGLRLPGQRRVHTSKESARRRRQLLDIVAAIEAETVIMALRRPPGLPATAARERLLMEATHVVIDRRVVSWHLDRQEDTQAERDRKVIETEIRAANRSVVYDHVPSMGEPVLWAVDAALWAVAAGGDWRRRAGERIRVVQIEP